MNGHPGLSPTPPRRPATFADRESDRANNFDAIRLALSLLVIVSHSYALTPGGNGHEPLMRASGGQMTLGEVAVDGFFLISGYLITASWRRSRGFFDYLRRRVLRIYPGFLVAIAFCGLVAGPLLSPDVGAYWRSFRWGNWALRAINLEDASPSAGAVNGSLWSIRYEFLCYLAVAALGLVGLLRRAGLAAGLALGCTAVQAAQVYFHFQVPGSRLTWLYCYPDFWPRLAACYMAGAAYHLGAARVALSGRLAALAALGLVAAAALPGLRLLQLIFPYLGGYLTFWIAYAPGGWLRGVARRRDLSYGLYLYAFPVQLLLLRWSGNRLGPLALAALATLATGVLAGLSWHLVEAPCLRRKRLPPVAIEQRAGGVVGPAA